MSSSGADPLQEGFHVVGEGLAVRGLANRVAFAAEGAKLVVAPAS